MQKPRQIANGIEVQASVLEREMRRSADRGISLTSDDVGSVR